MDGRDPVDAPQRVPGVPRRAVLPAGAHPRATQDLLHQRRDRLARRLTELNADLGAGVGAGRDGEAAGETEGQALPRVALIESEYLRAVTQAELAWVDGILAALDDGSFTWNREELDRIVATARDNT